MILANNTKRKRNDGNAWEYLLEDGTWLTAKEIGERCSCSTHNIRNRLIRHTPEEAIAMSQKKPANVSKIKLTEGVILQAKRRKVCVPKNKQCDHYKSCWNPYKNTSVAKCIGYKHTEKERNYWGVKSTLHSCL